MSTIVGDNDSGKSNILRALNLFFNDQTDPGLPLDFDNDFNRHIQLNRRAPQIEVELTFEIPERYQVMNGELVRWTKVWRQNRLIKIDEWKGLRSQGIKRGRERFEEIDIAPRSRLPGLLSRVEFEYIPAIRDVDFFRTMRGRIYKVIADVAEQNFRDHSRDFEHAIGEQVEPLVESLLEEMDEQTNLKLPNDLSEIFEKLDFLSGEKSISLDSRGDGIKGRYVPHILKFIAEQKQQLYGRGVQPYTFIWAYEEPENNLEFRRAQQLADFLKRLALDNLTQVLVTTHSPIFFNLRNEDPDLCTASFVSRPNDEQGTIAQSNLNTLDALDEKMGVMAIIAPHIGSALNEIDNLRTQSDLLAEQLEEHNRQNLPSIFVEGPSDYLIFMHILETQFPDAIPMVCLVPPPDRAGAGYVGNMLNAWALKVRHQSVNERCPALGILDRDEAGQREQERVIKLNGNFVTASLLSVPAQLQPAIEAGFALPISLEEQYPFEWWHHAENQGWLTLRNIPKVLSEQTASRIIQNEMTLDQALGDADWNIVALNCVSNHHKRDWADWICGHNAEQTRTNLPHLVQTIDASLVQLGVK